MSDTKQDNTTEESAVPAQQVLGFQPPAGYVLVPQAIYDMMMAQMKNPTPNYPQALEAPQSKKSNEKPIYLRVLRPIHLGDIKTQVNPEEIVEWVPRRSITIRGKLNTELGSFLSAFNKQLKGSRSYDPSFPPVFEVQPESQDDFDAAIGLATSKARPVTESDRIKAEERGRSTRRGTEVEVSPGVRIGTMPQPTQHDIDEIEQNLTDRTYGDNLPPRGSQARREMIHNTSIEKANSAGQRTAQRNEDFATPDQIPVQNSVSDQRTVAGIDGPPADEGANSSAKRSRLSRK